MCVLSIDAKFMTIGAALVEIYSISESVTDRQTDGRTDRHVTTIASGLRPMAENEQNPSPSCMKQPGKTWKNGRNHACSETGFCILLLRCISRNISKNTRAHCQNPPVHKWDYRY